MQHSIPLAFKARMIEQLGIEEASSLFAALEGEAPVSIQYHPTKGKPDETLKAVPWYQLGRYLPERPSFTLDPVFQGGAYYVQEAGSMLIAWLIDQLDMPDRPWRILDLCAAPGGKSCLLAAIMPEDSLLVSNEVIKSRANILRYNLAKWGLPGTWVTNLDPQAFESLTGFFDLVLVDAPCSGEGLFRKDPASRSQWSEENASLCSARQSRILRSAVPLLRPGGYLIYSTCTFNPEENIAQVEWLKDLGPACWTQVGRLSQVGAKPPPSWNIQFKNGTYSLLPHRAKAEGFFAAALTAPTGSLAAQSATRSKDRSPKKRKPKSRKGGLTQDFPHWTPLSKTHQELVKPWLAEPSQFAYYQNKKGRIFALTKSLLPEAIQLAVALPRIDLGLPIGQIKGKSLVPAPELAFHTALNSKIPRLEVDRETAINLMRKQTPEVLGLQSGFQLITYQGLGLLWLKGIGKRYNNYWPTDWRIRK
ncbi:MAG: RNA methyltransferase [Bacteroidota bacterium]